MDNVTRSAYWKNANKKAYKLLNKQRAKTGVAILGSPSQSLSSDPKFQGNLANQMILSGEKLAQASLASEFLVLKVANVPSQDHPKYTGRGQYPKFQHKSLVSPVPRPSILG